MHHPHLVLVVLSGNNVNMLDASCSNIMYLYHIRMGMYCTYIVLLYSCLMFRLCCSTNQKIVYIFLDLCRVSDNGLKESVNYQVISPKDLAKSVFSEAGWSNFLVLYIISTTLLSYYVFCTSLPPSSSQPLCRRQGCYFAFYIYASI
jgi:hypothetical protein